MITVAIAEDHQSLIDGIELLLKYEEGISIIGTSNDGKSLLDIVRLKQPKVVIMDIRMPKLDGIEATKIITKEFPHTKVIAFSMFDQDEAVIQMRDAGAKGYILKNSPLEELLNAIHTVMQGKIYYDTGINQQLFDRDGSHDGLGTKTKTPKSLLSKSEREILKLIAHNKTSSEIADIRFTAVSTVEKHRKNMMRKLGLSGKGELLKYAIQKKYEF
ncbi:response regulator transcription factor [uncultured Dokdonia sp.]|uniref:response regulator transcription factor n=1 Tax=uncultured Dokdonia sp. TaxID=575653 RepID=UPI0026351E0D|nr:response regulator transcription factor [uncultured Dokdonia sp.]